MDNKEFKHPKLAKALMLLQSNPDNKLIGVEGSTDYRFYKSRLKNNELVFVNCDGRDGVVNLIKRLLNDYNERICGICDSDLLTFGIGTHCGDKIFHTDKHDLEMDSLFYGNYDEHLSMQLKSTEICEKKFLSKALELARPLGALRFVSEQNKLNIDFREFKIKKEMLNLQDFSPKIIDICKAVLRKNKNHCHLNDCEDIISQVSLVLKNKHDPYLLCNGDDFVIAVRAILLHAGKKKLENEDIRINLIGAYLSDSFIKSNLGNNLMQFSG